ncbi:MAG: hypothetical protein IKC99_03920, partial [Clostridia bacterium]|nr:hypothetical protein [Clostridia bacterium]
MRLKTIPTKQTLQEVAQEFLSFKCAQKVRERTRNDYRNYIEKFLARSNNSLDIEILKADILAYFAEIPVTSPARYNHPYQYLHAFFSWCAK